MEKHVKHNRLRSWNYSTNDLFILSQTQYNYLFTF